MVVALAVQAVAEVSDACERFVRSTANLNEEISTFQPAGGSMTAAQQVAHPARVIDWLIEGAFSPAGFDLNFDGQIREVTAITSLSAAKLWFGRSAQNAIAVLSAKSDEELLQPIAPGPIMGGMPRLIITTAITDHAAHHRGALTVYARLNGIIPPDPYGM